MGKPPESTDTEKFRCSICGQRLERERFYTKGVARDSRCKVCVLKVKAKTYQAKQKAIRRKETALVSDEFTWIEKPKANPDAMASLEFLLQDLAEVVLWDSSL